MSAPTPAEDRVPLREKIALGFGNLPLYYGYAGVKSLAIPVYQMVRGLDPALLGVLLAAPRFWDALTDPWIGLRSDNLRSRWGRRRPLIVAGAVLQGITFGFLWMAPAGAGHAATAAYLSVALLLFYTSFSVFSVPLTSLGYEMTPDYDERTRVAAVGAFFAKCAELTYNWVFWVANLALFGSLLRGVRVVGWIVAALVMTGAGLVPGLWVRERYRRRAAEQQRVRWVPAVRAAAGNRAFLVLGALCLFQLIAGMLASSLDYYLLVYSLAGGNLMQGTKWKAILSTAYAVIGMAALWPVNRAAARYGKEATLAGAFVLVLGGAVAKWYVFAPGNPWRILLDPLLCGPIWPALSVLCPAMLADVCDEDEWRHGLRREGTLGALCAWIQKAGYALGLLLGGVALKLTGFHAEWGGAQSPRTLWRLRAILAGSTGVWAAGSLVLLAAYPLARGRLAQIRRGLEARRGAVNAPLSGTA